MNNKKQPTKIIAEYYAQGRIVSVFEGGYNMEALKESFEAHITVVMEE
jgi:acetoin utilization deacetylase AcuC-like enzyme